MKDFALKVGWSLLAVLSVLLFAALVLVALPFVGIGAVTCLGFDHLFDWLKDWNPFKREAPK